MTRVAAAVVTHGPCADLPDCLRALDEQVDELVVVRNIGQEGCAFPERALLVDNPNPVGYAENCNRGVAHTTADYVVVSNPDAVAAPDAIARLARFLDEHPDVGVCGPQMRYPDGTWQSSRRQFPTLIGSVVRRSPLKRLAWGQPYLDQHYLTGDVPDHPVEADWLLGGFLMLRRSMFDSIGGFDAGYRLYCEDIDLCYRAQERGWTSYYVPDALVVHRYAAVIDKRWFSIRTWWHVRGMVRYARQHPRHLLRRT